MLANVVYFKSMRSALELTYYADVSVTLCVFVRAHSLQGRRNLGTNGFMIPPKFGSEKNYLNIARVSFEAVMPEGEKLWGASGNGGHNLPTPGWNRVN